MSTPIESFRVAEDVDAYGTQTIVHWQGDEIVKQVRFDAAPLMEACKAERNATHGQRWGDTRKIGSIPMAVYAQFLTEKDSKARTKLIMDFLRLNTNFVTFDRFLK